MSYCPIPSVSMPIWGACGPGFHVVSFGAAFWGGIVLTLVNMLLTWLVKPERG